MSDEDELEMTDQTKERIEVVTKVAFPTLGMLTLLMLILAGTALSVMSVLGMMLFYEPAFFGLTFVTGVGVSCVGLVVLAGRLFELKKA